MRGWGRDWPGSIPVDGAGGSLRSLCGGAECGMGRSQGHSRTGWREFAGTLGWLVGQWQSGAIRLGV